MMTHQKIENFEVMVKKYAKPSLSLGKMQMWDAKKGAIILQELLIARAKHFVRAPCHRPIMSAHGSDGTPMRTMHYMTT